MQLTDIKGIGPKTCEYFNKLNIYNVDDLISYYPYKYNVFYPMNIKESEDNQVLVLTGKIASKPTIFYIRSNFNKISFKFETNGLLINISIFNRMYIFKQLYIGKYISLIGKYDKLKNNFNVSDIRLVPIVKTVIEPVYHRVMGLKLSMINKCINEALNLNINISEKIPNYIIDRYKLLDENKALREIHNPSNIKLLKDAKIKLKYEELFIFMFKIGLLKYKNQISNDIIIKDINNNILDKIISYIPFKLTSDQLNAINDIILDFRSEKRMNRLILGDVGSGKTIVSFIAILLNYSCGYQSALLAPTEVLARQHYDNFINLFGKLNLNVKLLVGSLNKSEKDNIKKQLSDGKIDLLIGTHAMLEDSVNFDNLGLVITDEQHRFGVNQRKVLQNKGSQVDVLYMSATPIPRTYALTIYGDMDITMIKEKPSGRKEIKTKLFGFNNLDYVYKKIEDELNLDHQIYVISPLIESDEDEETIDDDEKNELKDVKKIKKLLEDNLSKKYNIGILHGKMKNVDKDIVMNKFKLHEYDILVSTTVIEVGVDVKNATCMVIFNADRFGLATLHQLRGRVGRNELDSYCLLISDKDSDRLKVMEESTDGFYISEKDFELRGSGDLFGIRQHGDMEFKIADIRSDYKILLQCKKDSEEFINNNIENNFREYPYFSKLVDNLVNND